MQVLFQGLIDSLQVCPSIWGWKVDNNFIFMPNNSKNLFQIWMQIEVHK
jgi:hypothetical protein